MTREDLLNILKNSVATVIFTKADGSTRKMKCTLRSEFLPALKGSNNKRSMEVLPVWEIGVGWRSFRIDRVKEVIQ